MEMCGRGSRRVVETSSQPLPRNFNDGLCDAVLLRLGAQKYPDFTLAILLPMAESIEEPAEQDRLLSNMLPLFNPPPRPGHLVGIAPPRLDHIFIMAEDVDAATALVEELLVEPTQARPLFTVIDGGRRD